MIRLALILLVVWCTSALADVRPQLAISEARPQLAIDDCPVLDPTLTPEQLRRRGSERYSRGETLYVQGDYKGAVQELIASYCVVPPGDRSAFFPILKDIGQAYERDLDYEMAIAYLERYVAAVPPGATRPSACAPDPQQDKENVRRRIEVLRKLQAHVLVETTPPGARVRIEDRGRIAARGVAGKDIEVLGGSYDIVVELDGYQTVRRQGERFAIGKPYTYFIPLEPLKGSVSVQVTPADARLFLDDRFAGIGELDEELPAKKYTLLVEASGRLDQRRIIEVLPGGEQRLQIELAPKPQFGRRQLIAYSTIAGGFVSSSLLAAFDDTAIAGIGSLGGAAAGFLGTYLYLPDGLPLGTSNLTITSSIASGIAGAAAASLFTDREQVIFPVSGATFVAGATAGYYFGNRTRIRPGDAALINTTIVWGTVAGGLFSVAFDADDVASSGLILTGLGMGAVGGVLMTRSFDISRTHAALIDVGGIIGIIGGLAVESLAYGNERTAESQSEHLANFALGGMAVGLFAAGVLTRNLDAPKVPVKPALGTVTDAGGATTSTFGLVGSW